MSNKYHKNAKLWIDSIIAMNNEELESLTQVLDDCDDPDKHIEWAFVRVLSKYKEFVEELTVLEERL